MATGLGKTVVAAHIPEMVELRRQRKRGLFLVHRNELCEQAARKFHQYNPHLKVAIERADYRAEDADIVVASVQTLGKAEYEGAENEGYWKYGDRLTQFDPDQFSFLIVDECHHASAVSYQSVFRYFRVLKGEADCDPSKLFIGITATPNRSDNIGLEVLFDRISYNYGIAEGITDGWLTRIIAHRIETEHDISQVHITHGDFNQAELEAAVNTPARNELIAREYCKHKPEGPAFFFTVDIKHAVDLAEVMRAHGVKVYPISGHTPELECKRFMRLINEGEIDGLASAGKLIEGIDAPRVMTAAMCVPTKSKLRFQQMAGRVVRPFPAPEDKESHVGWVKPHALILDFCDLSGRHSLVTIASLFGLRAKFDAKGGDVLQQARAIEELEAQNPGLDFRDEPDLESARAKADKFKTSRHLVDLLKPPECPEELRKLSRFTWLKETEGSYHLGLMNNSMLSIRENGLGHCEVYRHVRGIRTKLYVAKDLKEAVEMAEHEVPGEDRKIMAATAAWRKEPPTGAQARLLFVLDRKLKREFRDPGQLHTFLLQRFTAGDISQSRGGVSARIDSLRAARS
jgi:superfamily II DNA or RNA helicase